MARAPTAAKAAKAPTQQRKPRATAHRSPGTRVPVGTTVLVDTAPFIYMLEDHPTLAARFAGLFEAERRGELSIAITPVSVAEVLVGPLKAGQEGLARRYERALLTYELVLIDAALAAQAARLRVRYRLRLPDALQRAAAAGNRRTCAGDVRP